MKKEILIVCIALLVPGLAYGGGYVIGTYGFGGAMDAPSWGAEMGGVFLSDLHPTGGALSAGVGFSVGLTGDSIPATSPSPKKFNDGNEYEGYANVGAELAPSLFGTLGIGYASQKRVTMAPQGEINSDTDTHVTGMVGLRYVIQGINAGIGFHTQRGIMLNLGVAF
jgi:hypothetical protein